MDAIPQIVYLELNRHGDPQVLVQKRAHAVDGVYCRIFDVFGEVGGLRACDADRPQDRFYLRQTEDLSPADLSVEADGAAYWAEAGELRVLGGWPGLVHLEEMPDLSAFWARAEFEEGSGI